MNSEFFIPKFFCQRQYVNTSENSCGALKRAYGAWLFLDDRDCPLPHPSAVAHGGLECMPPRNKIHQIVLCLLVSLLLHAAAFAIRGPYSAFVSEPVLELSLDAVLSHAPGVLAEAPGDDGSDSATLPSARQPAPQAGAPVSLPLKKAASGPTKVSRKAAVQPAPAMPNRLPKATQPASTQQQPPKLSDVASSETPQPSTTGEQSASNHAGVGGALAGSGNAALTPADVGQAGSGVGSGRGSGGGTGKGGGDGQPLQFGSHGGPSFLRRVLPQYPRLAVARQEQGTVLLLLHIDAAGQLTHAEIMSSAGPRLDEAALESVKASTYRPASTYAGANISCKALLPIKFTLQS